MDSLVTIPSRFNGPLSSGNGGYSAGVVAAFVDGPAEVSLRAPVPLDRDLTVRATDGGAELVDGDQLIAEGHAAELDLEVPEPVAVDAARDASTRYRGVRGEVFSCCFVCGLDRDDSFEVFAGQVEGRDMVASTWTPPAWTADGDGSVKPEFVWAVLDCPTFFAVHLDQDLTMSVLARLTANIDKPVPAEQEHVVMAWPVDIDGRKRHAGIAITTADGDTLARGRALLIEPR